MDFTGIKNLKHVFLETNGKHVIDETLPLGEQIARFQDKTTKQDKLIAEQAMQIYWLIAELRERDSRMSVS